MQDGLAAWGNQFNYGYQNWEIGSTRAIKIGKLVQP
jgi:hypothetical protein